MKVVLNGEEREVDGGPLFYDDVLRLVGLGSDSPADVTFSWPGGMGGGSLRPGESVELTEGTSITACITGSA